MAQTGPVQPGSAVKTAGDEAVRRQAEKSSRREAGLEEKVKRLEAEIKSLREENRQLRAKLARAASDNPPGAASVEV